MFIKPWAQTPKFCLGLLVLATSLLIGCAQLKSLKNQRILPSPSSGQLGVSPGARAIETSLGID